MDELYGISLVFILIIFWIQNTRDYELVKAKDLLRKLHLFIYSIYFMAFSKDSKGLGPKYNPDPDIILSKYKLGNSGIDKKRIVFIRHGESDWNNVFNKGINLSFIHRLFSALYQELLLLFRIDSKFIDSPLNHEGIEQADELSRFIQSTDHAGSSEHVKFVLDILREKKNDQNDSIVVSSCLRRAIATTTVALWSRIQKSKEKIILLNSLQEISRNIDTQSLAKPFEVPDLPFSRILPYTNKQGDFDPKKVYDVSESYGNKSTTFYGIKRFRAFNEWSYQRQESTIIVGGHSLWFKNFFNTFLPYSCTHAARTKKMANSAVVSFTLYRLEDDSGVPQYSIEPESIEVVYGGFTTK